MATVQSQVTASRSWSQLAYSAASVRTLARKPALFINNQWVNSTHGETLAVEDPSSGKEICRIVDASDADVDRAVAAARVAFDDGRWSNLPPNKRERIINKLADLIESHAAEFAELEAIDNGKPVGMASVVDIPGAVDHLRYMAGWHRSSVAKSSSRSRRRAALSSATYRVNPLASPLRSCRGTSRF
jgi:phenylacetaldehyde dehydrogenase